MGRLKYYNTTTAQWEYIREGGLAVSSIVTGEIPSGSVNSSNLTFTTSSGYVTGSTAVFVNGLMQRRGVDYTETSASGGTITFSEAPLTGDDVRVSYQILVTGTGNADTVDGFHAAATPTANSIPVLDGSAKLPIAASPVLKSTDANGWTKYDYGAFQKYIKKYGPYDSISMAPNGQASLSSSGNMPVGIAPVDVYLSSVAWNSPTSHSHQFLAHPNSYISDSVSTSHTYSIAIRNLTGATLAFDDVYMIMELTTI